MDKYVGWTPYNFAFNDPVGLNDLMGDDPPGHSYDYPIFADVVGSQMWEQIQAWQAMNKYDMYAQMHQSLMALKAAENLNANSTPAEIALSFQLTSPWFNNEGFRASFSSQIAATAISNAIQKNLTRYFNYSYTYNPNTGEVKNFYLEYIDNDSGGESANAGGNGWNLLNIAVPSSFNVKRVGDAYYGSIVNTNEEFWRVGVDPLVLHVTCLKYHN